MITRLAAGAAGKKGARNIDHMRRPPALVDQRRPAAGAEAANGVGLGVLETRDALLALGHAHMLAPAADIGGVGGAVGAAAGGGVIVPGPAGRHVDLDLHRAAEACP